MQGAVGPDPELSPLPPLNIPVLESETLTQEESPGSEATPSSRREGILLIDPEHLRPEGVVRVATDEAATQTSVQHVNASTQTSIHIEEDTAVVLIPGYRGVASLE